MDATPTGPAATPPPTATPPPAPTRSADLTLARAHLRLGSLALARAELETLAGRDGLDEDGVLDLAEARWRTGDAIGAGEAAELLITDGRGPVIALIIAAEAAMAVGRPSEARPYDTRAVDQAGGTLDAVFAGMPRMANWPVDPLVPPPEAMALFESTGPTPVSSTPVAMAPVVAAAAPGDDVAPPADDGAALAAAGAAAMGLWDEEEAEESLATDDGVPAIDAEVTADEVAAPAMVDMSAVEPDDDLPSGASALAVGRQAIEDGDRAMAAIQLGLAIRLDPSLAPAVVAMLDADRSPELALVRGDAYRLVGREQDARQAFVDAAGAPAVSPSPDEPQTDDVQAEPADHAEPADPTEPTDPAIDDDRHHDDPPPQGDPW